MNSTPWVSDLHSQTSVSWGVVGGRGCGQQDRPLTPLIFLDPRGRTLEIPGNSDPNIIPEGDFKSVVRVTGGSVLQSLSSAHPWFRVKPGHFCLIPRLHDPPILTPSYALLTLHPVPPHSLGSTGSVWL